MTLTLSKSTLFLKVWPFTPPHITCSLTTSILSSSVCKSSLLMPFRPVIPWPDHWYYDKDSIKCLVNGCKFTTETNGPIKQFGDIKSHCAETPGVEHAILLNMLGQRRCALCSYQPSSGQSSSNKLRNLFVHEKAIHGGDSMSRICRYIALARKGRINGRLGHDTQKIAFDRMVEKLRGFEQPVPHLLCHRAGLPHSLPNLRVILSTDHLRPDGDYAPAWWPVPADQFLWLLRPDPSNSTDDQWGRVWTRLRQMYRNGQL